MTSSTCPAAITGGGAWRYTREGEVGSYAGDLEIAPSDASAPKKDRRVIGSHGLRQASTTVAGYDGPRGTRYLKAVIILP